MNWYLSVAGPATFSPADAFVEAQNRHLFSFDNGTGIASCSPRFDLVFSWSEE
jgi:hypothetical protein